VQSNTNESPNHELELPGLDGANPLGFLAALGVLCVLDADARLAWRERAGTFVAAIITATEQVTPEVFVDTLVGRLEVPCGGHLALAARTVNESSDTNRHTAFSAVAAAASFSQRDAADWLAAFGCSIVDVGATNQLQTVRSDYFGGNIESVCARTVAQHLSRALFKPWDYADALDNQSLHFDPGEDRRHAYQWHKPSGDPTRKSSGGMLGANRLALEALRIFTSLPRDTESLRTLGFTGRTRNDTNWTWPLWSHPLSLPVVQSQLVTGELFEDGISDRALASLTQRGVLVCRC
jgi:CRISPR-associated endonuclease/helicase Cas3